MSEAPQIFLGRQPILDRSQSIVAYELLFRSGQTTSANVSDDVAATANVISHAFTELSVSSVLGKHKGFINFSSDLLLSDIIELLPKDQVVIELLETITVTPQIIARCKELKKMGFSLALDDYTSKDPQFEVLFDLVDVIKLDYPLIDKQALPGIVKHLQKWPVKLLAEKIDDRAQAELCMNLGFHLFQGYFYAKPVILTGKRTDPSKLNLLRLLGLVLGDAETGEIEQVFKHDPSLTFKMLKLVNSVGMGLAQKINSLSHAIAVLGRRQLQRWIQLLMFVPNSGETENPLLQLAAIRGKLMELLAQLQAPHDRDYQDRAFITGILSLLDTLLGMPLTEITEQINLAPDVKLALLERQGMLGELLDLAKKLEANDFATAGELLQSSGLSVDQLLPAQVEAMRWANNLAEQT
ncbi:MAG: EAL domain-containing protein [Sulfuricella sp.]|nr:EAL domain-containing protein [Sulfuricella sp.]